MNSGNNLFFSETIQNLIFIFRFKIYLNFKLYRYSVLRTYIIRNEKSRLLQISSCKIFLKTDSCTECGLPLETKYFFIIKWLASQILSDTIIHQLGLLDLASILWISRQLEIEEFFSFNSLQPFLSAFPPAWDMVWKSKPKGYINYSRLYPQVQGTDSPALPIHLWHFFHFTSTV